MKVIVETGKSFVLVLCAVLLVGIGVSRFRYVQTQKKLTEIKTELRQELQRRHKRAELFQYKRSELGMMDRETAHLKLIKSRGPLQMRIKSMTARGGFLGEMVFRVEIVSKGSGSNEENWILHFRTNCPSFNECQKPTFESIGKIYYQIAPWR